MSSPLTPQDFVAKWKRQSLSERAGAQEHFIDLCRLLGHPTPGEDHTMGSGFTFEAGLTKKGGGHGWADVWKRGFFAWEYKGNQRDLSKAYDQLLLYREALENPPLLIVSDMREIVVYPNFVNTLNVPRTISLDDLVTPDGILALRSIFEHPDFFRPSQTVLQVTEEAATAFAELADRLRAAGADAHQSAHFLIRLLFCLFAEDIGLLPPNLIGALLTATREDPPTFPAQLSQLFLAMTHGGWFGPHRIRHFNGGLFDDASVIQLDRSSMEVLGAVSQLDWSGLEPSILGTLFERSLDPAKRSQLGAHYTSREDILLIVEPVLLRPLRASWLRVHGQASALVASRNAATREDAKRRAQKQLTQLLTGFATSLSQITVLDPACGSGNFLYVALRELLNLEKEVITFASTVGVSGFFPSVSPLQFRGLEISEYARELAQATIWIGYIQWLRENGFGYPPEPLLKPLVSIELRDAVLSTADLGEPFSPEWPHADYVIGNPPFLGSRKMRPALGDGYCDALKQVYREDLGGSPDLVCYWFAKAHQLVRSGAVKRVGLLATQAIRGGTNRKVLEHVVRDGGIFDAWSDRPWVLDGAMVHVSIVCFDNGEEPRHRLNGEDVAAINADLTTESHIRSAKSLPENAGLSFQGVILRGKFNIPASVADSMLRPASNPNGRPNSDVIRPRLTGRDMVHAAPRSFVIDFGVDMPLYDAAQYAEPFEYVRRVVFPERQKTNQAAARERWWLHWNPRPEMRAALRPLLRYIATPRVSKHRIFKWIPSEVLPDAQLVVFARSDDYFFGVLHSRVHELWTRRMATQLREAESGLRYTSSTTFETFPMPWAPGHEDVADPRYATIAAAAEALDLQRNRWLSGSEDGGTPHRSLTLLYNQQPAWLALAHQELDAAVLSAYGWREVESDEDILTGLLRLNQRRACPDHA